MTKPLALLFCEQRIPGNRLALRLEDLGYRVQSAGADDLARAAIKSRPMVLIVDVPSEQLGLLQAIRTLKSDEATKHIPILAFVENGNRKLQKLTLDAGAKLVAAADGALAQLPQLLTQLLDGD